MEFLARGNQLSIFIGRLLLDSIEERIAMHQVSCTIREEMKQVFDSQHPSALLCSPTNSLERIVAEP